MYILSVNYLKNNTFRQIVKTIVSVVTDVLKTENAIKAINMLKNHTDKTIQVKDIEELADIRSYLGATYTDSKIIIYLNRSYSIDIQEAIFVHKILYQILRYEGLPRIKINETITRTLPLQFASVLPKTKKSLLFSYCKLYSFP